MLKILPQRVVITLTLLLQVLVHLLTDDINKCEISKERQTTPDLNY